MLAGSDSPALVPETPLFKQRQPGPPAYRAGTQPLSWGLSSCFPAWLPGCTSDHEHSVPRVGVWNKFLSFTVSSLVLTLFSPVLKEVLLVSSLKLCCVHTYLLLLLFFAFERGSSTSQKTSEILLSLPSHGTCSASDTLRGAASSHKCW